MKSIRSQIVLSLVFGALVVAAASAQADTAAKPATTAKPASTMSHEATAPAKNVTGEVVDMGCYLAHEAHGEKHIACGTKCVAGGMPMGLLTADGGLYLLTLNHDNADPYNALKKMVGKNVTVTGPVNERGGMKGIDVTGAKLVAAK
ncbi:MAG TPA: hypothetical protein VKF80_02755 [Candidatus Eisenbacteria bacterium]|nr:hypothetical protein [Candidatus Eisenbacteria bacterium]